MEFSEVLPAIMEGKRARRALWLRLGGAAGDWVQRVTPPSLDGQDIAPQIMSWLGQDQRFHVWGGINRDIQASDWEILGGPS